MYSRHNLARAYSKGHDMSGTISDLKRLAAMSRKTWWITDEMAGEILTELTKPETKKQYALKLAKDAQSIYAIPESELTAVAEGLSDPSTRRSTEHMLSRFGYADPNTEWAGTGYSIIMDRVYAENEPLAECHIVAIPAQWSKDLWHGERDLTEDGYQYSHWVYAELPSITIWDLDTPVSCVLVSEDIYGTLYWGSNVVSLYRGEVTIRESAITDFGDALSQFKSEELVS